MTTRHLAVGADRYSDAVFSVGGQSAMHRDCMLASIDTGSASLRLHIYASDADRLAEMFAAAAAEFRAAAAKPDPEPIPVAEATESGFGDLDGAEYPAWTVPGREFS